MAYRFKRGDPYGALARRKAAQWEEGRNVDDNAHGVREARTPSGSLTVAAATPTLVLTYNARRRYAAIVNAGSNPVYVHFRPNGSDVGAGGIYLRAEGGAVWFGLATDFPYVGAVSVYSTAGTTITYMEN